MARWRARRPALALEAAPAPAESSTGLLGPDDPDARREHWGTLAMDLLRDTEVPTATILGAYVDRVLA